MSFWAFYLPLGLCAVSIIGGIALHFYAEWSGKREEEREERFWAAHQTEWTDELARRRAMRARAEKRYATQQDIDEVSKQLEDEGYTRIGKYEWQRNQGTVNQ